MKIILTDVHLRKSFDVYNILLRYYPFVDIILVSHKINFFLKKSYKTKILEVRKNQKDFFIFLNDVLSKYKSNKIVYLPVEEDTTILFYQFLKTSNKYDNIKYLLPSLETFNTSRDKKILNYFCIKNKILVPKIYNNIDDIKLYPDKYLPLIIKPNIGYGSKNLIYINDKKSLYKLKKFNSKNSFIQERLDNPKNVIGAFFLVKNKVIIDYYLHERIRTSPEIGGVSVYSKTCKNDKVFNIGKKTLEKLNWNGLVMIEFLYCRNSNSYKIIEINPRIWGTILLSEFSKANLIKKYIDFSLNNKKKIKSINFNKKHSYYIKWLIPFEIINFFRLKINIREFIRKTCYINISYSTLNRSIAFHFYHFLNINSMKKLYKKMK